MGIITIEEKIGVPKYKQIISSVENALINNELKRGDKLPSINSVRNRYSLSRDTVLIAYNDLKVRGVIQSIPGKGYYVKSENVNVSQKIFLLFDELNAFKEDLYTSFIKNLDDTIDVDIYFHHFNQNVFNNLIYDNLGSYSYYVIMPANLKATYTAIEKLPKDKVYILDQSNESLIEYPAIFQNFEKDIFNGLTEGVTLLKKYQNLVLLFQDRKQPPGMLRGFNLFCKMNGFKNEVINSLEYRNPKKGEVYIIPDDRNLIRIIKKTKESQLKLSKDIGIISYNDTLLKEIVEDGITTISTDFYAMGKRLAQMVMNKEQVTIENSNRLILRNSL